MAAIDAKDIVVSESGNILECMNSGTLSVSTNVTEGAACRGVAVGNISRSIDSKDHTLQVSGEYDPDGTYGFEEIMTAYLAGTLVDLVFGTQTALHTIYTAADMIITDGSLAAGESGKGTYDFTFTSSGTALVAGANP